MCNHDRDPPPSFLVIIAMTATTLAYRSIYCKYKLKDKIWFIQNGYSRLRMRWKIKVHSCRQMAWPPLSSAAFLCPTKPGDTLGEDTSSFPHSISQNACFQHIPGWNVNLSIEGASPFVSEIPTQNQLKLFSGEKLGHVFLTTLSPKNKFIRR